MFVMNELTRDNRFHESEIKIRYPFKIDPSLCIYSPQENVDSIGHPKIKSWVKFIKNEWTPSQTPKGLKRVALIIPCTKYKPYLTSREHKAINNSLFSNGWNSIGVSEAPTALEKFIEENDDQRIFHEGSLKKNNLILDRIVISEPLGLVPYEFVYYWKGKQSPATSYDDPGLFESRGTSVSPYRQDCTATKISGQKWRWGIEERSSYVQMHNHLVEVVTTTLLRVSKNYHCIGAWVSPGLTHRSFLADKKLRHEEKIPLNRKTKNGIQKLFGVLDFAPNLLTIMPTVEQLKFSQKELRIRLKKEGRNSSPRSVRAVYARGDGNDTPLGLYETLQHLLKWLNKIEKNNAYES